MREPKSITVKEMIDVLSKLNPELEVWLQHDGLLDYRRPLNECNFKIRTIINSFPNDRVYDEEWDGSLVNYYESKEIILI